MRLDQEQDLKQEQFSFFLCLTENTEVNRSLKSRGLFLEKAECCFTDFVDESLCVELYAGSREGWGVDSLTAQLEPILPIVWSTPFVSYGQNLYNTFSFSEQYIIGELLQPHPANVWLFFYRISMRVLTDG